jgi:alanyl-tRNA synthetase
MKTLSSQEIRQKFLSYFEKHQHLKIAPSPLVPRNDPTLLFINSGMAPLKNYFLGKEEPPQKCLTNFQPCIRTKDIDDVGDRHHLTLFEMLGSWSIGDYYKEEACRLAYGLLVNEFGFDPKKLYMTVYGGSKEKNIECDEESVQAWLKCGVASDHIIRLGEDNFGDLQERLALVVRVLKSSTIRVKSLDLNINPVFILMIKGDTSKSGTPASLWS